MKTKKSITIIVCVALLLLSFSGYAAESVELLNNGGFEKFTLTGKPTDWAPNMYRRDDGISRVIVTDEKARTGKYSALVENGGANDARFISAVAVEPQSMYRLSGYIWVESMEETGNGANLAVEDVSAFSTPVFDTFGQWQYVECYGETGPNQRQVNIGVRVGGYSKESTGKAYFDDISMVKITSLPEDVIATLWYRETSTFQDAVASAEKGKGFQQNPTLFFAMALAFVMIASLVMRGLKKTEGQALEKREGEEARWTSFFWILMLFSFVIRIVLARNIEGYQVDISCFGAWSLRMVDVGPLRFYEKDYFCDYPPGAMLALWPVGLLLKLVGWEDVPNRLLIIKSIPILCDMLIGLFLFCFIRKRCFAKIGFLLAALFLISPATLVNGAAWGQIDSLLALFMLLAAYYAMQRRWHWALPIYILGALVKPQALLFAPVGGIWLIASLLRAEEKAKEWKSCLYGIFISLGMALAIIVPFAIYQENPWTWLWNLYADTVNSYGYATVNAANFYYLLGANWKDLLLPMSRLVPLFTGLLLLGFGLWKTELYKGFSRVLEEDAVLRADLKGIKATTDESKKILLAGLCAFAGIAFLVLFALNCHYQLYGIVMMVFVYLWALLGALVDADMKKLPVYMAVALIGVYVLGIKIHERYLFSALPLLLVGYGLTGDKRLLGLFAGFSATTFLNTAIVLNNSILYGSKQGHLNNDTMPLNIFIALVNLLLCFYAGYVSYNGIHVKKNAVSRQSFWGKEHSSDIYRKALLSPGEAQSSLTQKDWLIMGTVTILYGFLAFFNLGSMEAPQTNWVSTSAEEEIVFELSSEEPYFLLYYAGVSHYPFSVSVSDDGENWSEPNPCDMRQGLCFRWKYAIATREEDSEKFLPDAIANRLILQGKYLKLHAEAAELNLFEILARTLEGQGIPMKVVSHTGARENPLSSPKRPENLLDEAATLQGEPGWFNGTYFDEIYHARTAYEHLHGLPPYETTHPPLGKLFMSVAIAIFGMTPFGWRFAGTLSGVLMLPVMYALTKQLFKRKDLATFAMMLFALDLMHFTQTRIATIDSFPVLFIMLSYLFMAKYVMQDTLALEEGETVKLWSDAFYRSLIPLALSGLFMGLSFASKWIGGYSAVGLAILFFFAQYRRYRMSNVAFEYAREPSEQEGMTAAMARSRIIGAQDYTLWRIGITCLLCLLFFVAVPALIYYLSYIPYLSPTGKVTLMRVLDAQQRMLDYHATPGLGMDHPFQSPWWQWPLILKPIWYVQDSFEPAGIASTIMCLGNPVVFYGGAIAMAALLVVSALRIFRFRGGLRFQQERGSMVLPIMVIGFLAQYLPWVLVPRSMYFYHYFASVPFIILATVWAASYLPESKPRLTKGVLGIYVLLAAVFFILFYPYASGMPVSIKWLEAMNWFGKLYY